MIRKLIYVFCIILLCKTPCFAYINTNFGFELDKNRWGIIVKDVFQNYPAIEAGLSDGDYILKLNNTNVSGMNFNDFCYMLNKWSNKPITLEVRRGEDLLNFKISPIDAWKIYLNRLSDKLINKIDTKPLPQFYTATYQVRIKEKSDTPELIGAEYSENEKDDYDDDFLKEIIIKSVNEIAPLPDNYDEAVVEIQFGRDGINNKVSTKLISNYKKASLKMFNNLAQTANFFDIINSFKSDKTVKNTEMTLLFRNEIPVGEIYDGKILSCSNLKTKSKNETVKLLDKVTALVKPDNKRYINSDGRLTKVAGYSEITVKVYPVMFNGMQFEVLYRLKQSKGFFYKYPKKSIVAPSQLTYSYYISCAELKPVVKNKPIDAFEFSKKLYSQYKKTYPELVLEKTKGEYSISKKTCYRLKGKEVIIEIIPDKTNSYFTVIYYNLIDTKALNKEYSEFLKHKNQNFYE